MTSLEDALLYARLIRPYYTRALAALAPVPWEGGTLAVTKNWHLLYDQKFLDSITVEQAGTIIGAHEIEHLLRGHNERCGSRNPMLWNVAGDAEINDDIPEADLPPGHIRPAVLGCKDNLLGEEYYESCDKMASKAPRCGSGAGNPVEGEPQEGGLKPIEEEGIKRLTASEVKHYAKSHPGKVPAGIEVWADEILKVSPIDWRRELTGAVRTLGREMTLGRNDYSFNKPSLISARPALLPGTVSPKPAIGILVDTSGSVLANGAEILTAVKSICRGIGQTVIYSCDVEAHRIKDGKMKGGGGTDLTVGFTALEKHKLDLVVVLTDGETPWPQSVKWPVIVGLVKENKDVPAWVKKVITITTEDK